MIPDRPHKEQQISINVNFSCSIIAPSAPDHIGNRYIRVYASEIFKLAMVYVKQLNASAPVIDLKISLF